MEPAVLYQDENILVVDKPAGMVVNRADTTRGIKTLQDWVDKQVHSSQFPSGVLGVGTVHSSRDYIVNGYNKLEEFKSRSGIVHRLDKETSGIIIIAKNPETFINLQNQFKKGEVRKTYLTLLHGKLEPTEGIINSPIGRLPWNRTRFGILPEGRKASTSYKVLSHKIYRNKNSDEILSLVEVYPKTGRTHQIRVHFQSMNHPVFGDELYAGRKTGKSDRKVLPRHFLHASKIKLKDPQTQKELVIQSNLPLDLATFLDSLPEAS